MNRNNMDSKVVTNIDSAVVMKWLDPIWEVIGRELIEATAKYNW
jgi:hypothetical protein